MHGGTEIFGSQLSTLSVLAQNDRPGYPDYVSEGDVYSGSEGEKAREAPQNCSIILYRNCSV